MRYRTRNRVHIGQGTYLALGKPGKYPGQGRFCDPVVAKSAIFMKVFAVGVPGVKSGT